MKINTARLKDSCIWTNPIASQLYLYVCANDGIVVANDVIMIAKALHVPAIAIAPVADMLIRDGLITEDASDGVRLWTLTTGTKPLQKANPKKVPPTESEAKEYYREKGYHFDLERFFCHYNANGWMVGRTKMKCWKSAMRTWEINWKENDRERNTYGRKYSKNADRYANLDTFANGLLAQSTDCITSQNDLL